MTDMNNVQFVELEVGGEKYAVSILDIQEIIRPPEITPIPNTNQHIVGVMNLRGKIVVIVSLRSRFGLPEDRNQKYSRIVVVNYREESIGLWVDRVNQVTKYQDIQPPPARLQMGDSELISGIGRAGNGMVGILNLDLILSELSTYEYS